MKVLKLFLIITGILIAMNSLADAYVVWFDYPESDLPYTFNNLSSADSPYDAEVDNMGGYMESIR